MHVTGDYVSSSIDFSLKWAETTSFYLDKIQNDLTSDNWTAIFQALHHAQESRIQGERIQTGAPVVPQPHQALLPANPPTPPLLSVDLPTPPPLD